MPSGDSALHQALDGPYLLRGHRCQLMYPSGRNDDPMSLSLAHPHLGTSFVLELVKSALLSPLSSTERKRACDGSRGSHCFLVKVGNWICLSAK